MTVSTTSIHQSSQLTSKNFMKKKTMPLYQREQAMTDVPASTAVVMPAMLPSMALPSCRSLFPTEDANRSVADDYQEEEEEEEEVKLKLKLKSKKRPLKSFPFRLARQVTWPDHDICKQRKLGSTWISVETADREEEEKKKREEEKKRKAQVLLC
ncbi:uncharacterized protein ARB_06288 [Trichophyton benhamiae CBS 112371]|uniref:Uncharacterized protein n=1 Tax=Arthroderma benhamiae (strain ATCC MYA-4681 / CBS 112371) TaxID=663331 RepID=D4APY1_ARTBC|nr:uncharacterized protein ARB_06288 [Trichophyton benhamiae CBS 112371]EFE34525.1 hypothetical protein ARB_06288 [Trichophyton benhamiae CBS 112371]